jgi:trimethylamine-N-oxide reductase (cytochrome c)
MSDGISKLVTGGAVETRVRSIGFLGLPGGGAEGVVDVKNGKIVRIRPLHYDWKYDK